MSYLNLFPKHHNSHSYHLPINQVKLNPPCVGHPSLFTDWFVIVSSHSFSGVINMANTQSHPQPFLGLGHEDTPLQQAIRNKLHIKNNLNMNNGNFLKDFF